MPQLLFYLLFSLREREVNVKWLHSLPSASFYLPSPCGRGGGRGSWFDELTMTIFVNYDFLQVDQE